MIPRKMREELGYKVYIMKGFDGSLSLYNEERYQKLVAEFSSLPKSGNGYRVLSEEDFEKERKNKKNSAFDILDTIEFDEEN